jgi:hypothetical protein
MKSEIWKDIPDYEDIYQVSDFGRVRSVRLKKTRILKPFVSGYPRRYYLSVGLYKDKIRRCQKIHSLVARSFIGLKNNSEVVDHIDNNPCNNRVENLQYITVRLNNSKDQKKCTSKYTGVSWHKKNKKWVSYIQTGRKTSYLGSFHNEYEAHLAYVKAVKEVL